MAGRILIADDVATSRMTLRVQLASSRYDVTMAESPRDLDAYLRLAAPDLMILADRFGALDGPSLVRQIRARAGFGQTPILAVLDRSRSDVRTALLAAGADDILQRGHSPAALMARVRALLRAGEMRAETLRRKETAAAFGFAETAVAFESAARISFVTENAQGMAVWTGALPRMINGTVSVQDPLLALDDSRGNHPADAFVVDSSLPHAAGGLAFLSELRSRGPTRHAAILYVHAEDDPDAGATALDLGANGLVAASAKPEELALRLRTLLKRKAEGDALRKTVEDGLRLAAIDSLTGLYNRRYAMAYLERAAKESERTGKPFAVMVADLDHFKSINDSFGHAAGDAVLRKLARTIRDGLRGEDLVARLGGEEFLIVMPATDLDRARPAAERLCRKVSQMSVKVPRFDKPIRATISIGGAVGGATGTPADVDTLVARADEALYRAKSGGRNKVDICRTAA